MQGEKSWGLKVDIDWRRMMEPTKEEQEEIEQEQKRQSDDRLTMMESDIQGAMLSAVSDLIGLGLSEDEAEARVADWFAAM